MYIWKLFLVVVPIVIVHLLFPLFIKCFTKIKTRTNDPRKHLPCFEKYMTFFYYWNEVSYTDNLVFISKYLINWLLVFSVDENSFYSLKHQVKHFIFPTFYQNMCGVWQIELYVHKKLNWHIQTFPISYL